MCISCKLYYILLHIDVQYYDLSLNMIQYFKNCISTERNKQCFFRIIIINYYSYYGTTKTFQQL